MSYSPTALYLNQELRAIERAEADAKLMQRAGSAVAELAKQLMRDNSLPVLIVAGPGNNGGDALVAARHLLQAWHRLHVVFMGDPDKLPADARQAHAQWLAAGGRLYDDIPQQEWGLVIDGLFGIGLQRPVEGSYAECICSINDIQAIKLAIDVPSGLCGDSGRVLGTAVRADHTLALIGRQPGLYTFQGPDHAGHIHCDSLGLDPARLTHASGHLLEAQMFMPALPPRLKNSHKGSNGSLAVIGGDRGMLGAVMLAGRAALFSGSGRVYVASLAEPAAGVVATQPELMLRDCAMLPSPQQLDCVVIGPGMGTSDKAGEILAYWLRQEVPLLLDADALNLLAAQASLRTALQGRRVSSVITPHPGEAGRLLGCSSQEVQQDRIGSARRLAQELGVDCVLKGIGTLCAEPAGQWYINSSGNPGLATAGSGDVLSGIIGGFVAQGLGTSEACRLGVYLHGAAADELVSHNIGPVGLTASELIPAVRNLINHYNRQQQ